MNENPDLAVSRELQTIARELNERLETREAEYQEQLKIKDTAISELREQVEALELDLKDKEALLASLERVDDLKFVSPTSVMTSSTSSSSSSSSSSTPSLYTLSSSLPYPRPPRGAEAAEFVLDRRELQEEREEEDQDQEDPGCPHSPS